MKGKERGPRSKKEKTSVFDEMEESGFFDGIDEDCFCSETPPEACEKRGNFAIEDIGLLLRSALTVYTYDKNRETLDRSLRAIGEYAALFPAEEIRPALRATSPEIDELLAFTDVWQPLCWKEMVGGDSFCTDEEMYFMMFECWPDDNGSMGSVPFLAFLLAGTEFAFTEDELSSIRSGAGTSVGELRGSARGKESAAQ